MAKNTPTNEGLQEEIDQLRELLRLAGTKVDGSQGIDELLAVLDSVARAAPQLAHLLKSQRELAKETEDPAALLRQALEELEEEWPELHECKERLRNGGAAADAKGAEERKA